MTMSERTITVKLTGPQYRALLEATALATAEYESGDRDWEPGYSQKWAALRRARDKVIRAWERS